MVKLIKEGIMENNYVIPEVDKESFHCPNCNVLTHQFWSELYMKLVDPKKTGSTMNYVVGYKVSQCYSCKKYSIWHQILSKDLALDDIRYEMIYPTDLSYFPEPNPDLTDDIKRDYFEAGKILKDSPRGAAALLRLCVQKLVDQLEPGNGNINDKIAKMVKKGLETEIQEALDLTRVIGNFSVHPGKLDLKDDQETAKLLFETINLIAEKLVSRPKRISKAYLKLPPNKLKAIEERDGK